MEIGSEFWIDENQLIEISELDNKMPNWLEKYGNIKLTSSGRGAISLIIELVNPKIKKVLLPSYICDSVILPFENSGYEITYYDVDKYFSPINIDMENFEMGIFFHMGYFGFRTNEILSDTISKLRAKSVIIIEDVTHTLFSSYENHMRNDFVVGSIRKWFGTPSGGFLASSKIINNKLPYPPSEFIDLRVSSLRQKFEYFEARNKTLKDDYLEGFGKAEQLLDKDVNSYGIDIMSEMIIKDIDTIELKRIRRINFEFLLSQLKDVSGVEVAFKNIKYDITPMFFPIYVKHNRDKLRLSLIEKEIYCPVHWPIPTQMNRHLSSTTKKIYDTILSIPCDQRYQIEDMHRLINEICNFVKKDRKC